LRVENTGLTLQRFEAEGQFDERKFPFVLLAAAHREDLSDLPAADSRWTVAFFDQEELNRDKA
jgi:hypothetical protein